MYSAIVGQMSMLVANMDVIAIRHRQVESIQKKKGWGPISKRGGDRYLKGAGTDIYHCCSPKPVKHVHVIVKNKHLALPLPLTSRQQQHMTEDVLRYNNAPQSDRKRVKKYFDYLTQVSGGWLLESGILSCWVYLE